jgi:hypothetical protein
LTTFLPLEKAMQNFLVVDFLSKFDQEYDFSAALLIFSKVYIDNVVGKPNLATMVLLEYHLKHWVCNDLLKDHKNLKDEVVGCLTGEGTCYLNSKLIYHSVFFILLLSFGL